MNKRERLKKKEELRQILHKIQKLPDLKREAALELIHDDRMELAYHDFYTFLVLFAPKMMPNDYIDGAHVHIYCEKLQEVEVAVAKGVKERTEKYWKKLMFALAPGAMKSVTLNLFVAWCLGRHPDWKVMQLSHTLKLCIDNCAIPVKSLMKDEDFVKLFPLCVIDERGDTQDSFRFTQGGAYFAGATGTKIAGRRYHIAVIDDAISEKEAESKTERDKINQWYIPGLRSRRQKMCSASEVMANCLVAGTLVSMADGSQKPIEEVTPGDSVVSMDENFNITTAPVEAFFEYEPASIWEIKTQSGVPIKGTGTHPLYVEQANGNRGYVNLEDLNVGDYLLTPFRQPESFCEAQKIDENEAYLLGFMFGDGWTIQSTRKDGYQRYVTCWSPGIYPEENKKILSLFEELFNVTCKFQKGPGYYRTDRKHVCEWFREHGMIGNAHTKRIPDWVFRQPENIRQSFFDGFVHADGHITKTNQTAVGLCNYDLVHDVKRLAYSLGRTAGKITTKQYWVQPPNSPEPIYATQHRVSIGGLQSQDQLKKVPITEVTKLDDKEIVYDITVTGTHNFIANQYLSSNTRWNLEDLCGFLIKKDAKSKFGGWEEVKFPAILTAEQAKEFARYIPEDKDLYVPGGSFWPQLHDLGELEDFKESNTPAKWAALYMQTPIAEGGAVFDKRWFRPWKSSKAPECSTVLMSMDTAISEKQKADYTAITVWGIFTDTEEARDENGNKYDKEVNRMVLLHNERGRWAFHDLYTRYEELEQEFRPDTTIVEKAASGHALITEMARFSKSVEEFSPGPGKGDKGVRANLIAPYVRNGGVYVHTIGEDEEDLARGIYTNEDALKEFLDEVGTFTPGSSSHDDYVDSMVMAIHYAVEMGLLRVKGQTDLDEDEDSGYKRRRKTYF